MKSVCKQCGKEFGWDKPTVVAWIGQKLYSFCDRKCREEFLYPKYSYRICAREQCYRRVPEENRMLCRPCYLEADNLGEHYGTFSGLTDRAHWQRMDKAIKKRFEGKVQVFSAQDMTQEELSSLVPSLREETE